MSRVLRVHSILHGTTVNGPGIRSAVWTQTCVGIECPGCWNPDTWDPAKGTLWDPQELAEAIVRDAPSQTQGVTLSGGEPFQQAEAAAALLDAVAQHKADWSRFAFTGYTVEYLRDQGTDAQRKLLSMLDIVVDGPYVAARRTDKKLWCGSDNQRVLGVTPRGRSEIVAATGSPGEFEIVFHPDGTVVGTGFPPPGVLKAIRK